MKLSARLLSGLALVAALAGLSGCTAQYDHTDIGQARASVLGGHVDRQGISVPEGMIVTVHIVSYNDDDNIMTMNLTSKDPSILEVSNVISDHDFAFIGMKQGTTDVELRAGDRVVLVMQAVVGPQPSSPSSP